MFVKMMQFDKTIKAVKMLTSVMLAASSMVASAQIPQVATDIPAVHSLVAKVMGSLGEPSLLLNATVSTHHATLKPSMAAKIRQADMVVWVGNSFTPWLGKAINSIVPDAVSLELDKVPSITLLAMRDEPNFAHDSHGEHGHDEDSHDEHDHDEDSHDEDSHDEDSHDEDSHDEDSHDEDSHDEDSHDEHDHDEHTGHTSIDPHVWLDPQNAKIWLDLIATELSKLDTANKMAYENNAANAKQEIDILIVQIVKQLNPVQNKNFFVFHDAYQYFENRFGLKASGTIFLGDASKPGIGRLADIRDMIASGQVNCVFTEPQFDKSLLAAVATEDQIRLGELDPLGLEIDPGQSLYPLLLRQMADSFTACLQ